MFYHSLVSDWNHGNAHFLRGIATELQSRGHQVRVYEPEDAWSVQNLKAEHGDSAIAQFKQAFPSLHSIHYNLRTLDLGEMLDGVDLVLVHEWSPHALVSRIGEHRASARNYRLLFHDTHHRSVTERAGMAAYDLKHYDGVLAFGQVIRDLYLKEGWAPRAWTWHEAADTRVFRPLCPNEARPQSAGLRPRDGVTPDLRSPRDGAATARRPVHSGDLVWIGNWGDDERAAELLEFVIEPVRNLKLKARLHGVRYPDHAKRALAEAGIDYGGWLPNYEAPRVFAEFKVTVHVPRRPYVETLPGIPTIRVFEALACGIPLVCAPWDDAEHLFTPGKDYLVARNGDEMQHHLRAILNDHEMARAQAAYGLRTIRARHTCAYRVDELLNVYRELQGIKGPASDRRRPPHTFVANGENGSQRLFDVSGERMITS
jgi:spore maturation protein CgeB